MHACMRVCIYRSGGCSWIEQRIEWKKRKKNSDKNCNTQTHSNCAETYVNESFRFVLAIAGDLAEHVCSGKLNGMERKKCVPTKYHATLVLERHKIAITTATSERGEKN